MKSVEWMTDLVSNLSIAGELVLNTCDGIFLTAKACLNLLQHRRFVGSEEDSACFQDAFSSLAEMYAR